jgi:hypothetical protein
MSENRTVSETLRGLRPELTRAEAEVLLTRPALLEGVNLIRVLHNMHREIRATEASMPGFGTFAELVDTCRYYSLATRLWLAVIDCDDVSRIRRASPPWLRDCIDGAYDALAADMSDLYRSTVGSPAAAELVKDLIGERRVEADTSSVFVVLDGLLDFGPFDSEWDDKVLSVPFVVWTHAFPPVAAANFLVTEMAVWLADLLEALLPGCLRSERYPTADVWRITNALDLLAENPHGDLTDFAAAYARACPAH